MGHQFFFTPFILDKLPAPSHGFDVFQDLSEPRLRVYITSRGVTTFFVRKRVNNRDKRIIIGKYPEITVEQARAAVPEILTRVTTMPRHRRAVTFKRLITMYMENRVRRSEYSRTKLERAINRHLASLFDKNITKISSDDVRNVIAAISGPAISGRMQELLQSVFSYAIDSGFVCENPVVHLDKIPRIRHACPLNKIRFQRLMTAINETENQNLRAAFLMLVYGFTPKSQIFAMQWRDLDFNLCMWGERPLADAAVVVLQDVPQNGRWVFPGRGRGHLTDPRYAWRHVVSIAGMPQLTMDDVYKYLTRQLVWTPNKAQLRENMNNLLNDLTSPL